jgi:hypothetical protein
MADYGSSSRHNSPTYDGTTDHTNPQRVQVKNSSNNRTTVTSGGPEKWQRGHAPNGGAVGLGPSADGIAHAKTEKARGRGGVLTSLADWLRWRFQPAISCASAQQHSSRDGHTHRARQYENPSINATYRGPSGGGMP